MWYSGQPHTTAVQRKLVGEKEDSRQGGQSSELRGKPSRLDPLAWWSPSFLKFEVSVLLICESRGDPSDKSRVSYLESGRCPLQPRQF